MSAIILPLFLCAFLASSNADQNSHEASYGVDVSIPIHHHQFRDDDLSLSNGGAMGHRRRFYRDFMNSWKQNLIKRGDDPSEADEAEQDRIQGNLEQPAMVVNYTSTGYLKMRAPQEVRDILTQFWESNRHLEVEEWRNGIINQLDSPTTMVSLDDERMRGSGDRIKKAIWDATRPIVSEWTGQSLTGSSIYGIRVSRTEKEASATKLRVFGFIPHPQHLMLGHSSPIAGV